MRKAIALLVLALFSSLPANAQQAGSPLSIVGPIIPIPVPVSSGGTGVAATPPTITSGFGSGANITGNMISFVINVGTGGVAQTGVLGLPTAPTGWICLFQDVTNPGLNVTVQSGMGTASSVTLQSLNYSTGSPAAWTASDNVIGHCFAH